MKLAQGYVGLTDGFPDRNDTIEQEFVLKMFLEAINHLIATTSRRNGQREVFKNIRTDYLEGDPKIKKDFDKLVRLIPVHPLIFTPLSLLMY